MWKYSKHYLLGILTLGLMLSSFSAQANTNICEDINDSIDKLRSRQSAVGYLKNERSVLTIPENSTAIAVIAHGYNAYPDTMDKITNMLNQNSIATLRVTFSGHGQYMVDKYSKSGRKEWLADVREHYCIAQAYAEEHNLPIYLGGYSLGATMMQELVTQWPDSIDVKKIILWSFGIKPVKALEWAFAADMMLRDIDSTNSNKQRAHRALQQAVTILPEEAWPLQAYLNPSDEIRERCDEQQPLCYLVHNALFPIHLAGLMESGKRIGERKFYGAKDIDTLVLMEPEDEFGNYADTAALLEEYDLNNWELFPLNDDQSTFTFPLHHFIIDQNSLGAGEWVRMSEKIIDFLNN